MRIPVDQVEETPKHLRYVEEVGDLNVRLASGSCDFQVPGRLDVDLEYYRAGLDVYFDGTVRGDVRGTCARCAEDFSFPLDAPVRAVLAPRAIAPAASAELDEDDLGLSFYEGDEIDVTALVHEHAILALPTRALCAETCRGLCPRCGANLNVSACGCAAQAAAGPFAGLRTPRRAT
jgi:uncharacterized protein